MPILKNGGCGCIRVKKSIKLKNALIIFVKNPVPGKVKTRLAKDIGAEKALQVYQILTELTRNAARQVTADRFVYYSDTVEPNDRWPNDVFIKKQQLQTPDLGLRMYHAFSEVLQNHDKAVIIGSDCPTITPELIEEAFEQLNHYDVVIGPATDGGYYLLALKQAEKNLFEHKEWSTSLVLKNTRSDLERLNMSYHLLPRQTDVDDLHDLRMVNLPELYEFCAE